MKNPAERLTRAELVLELLEQWEKNLAAAERKYLQEVAKDLEAAIRVLKSSYSAYELMDFTPLYAGPIEFGKED